MSGDVQPRRRKDKKRKRDDRKSEGEVIFSRKQSLQEDDEASHGVQSANMGVEDQHIHVHEDHGTGGNWYQKCAFIVLMAILLGLVGLIIVENRGLADLDTPLSESRYSDYLHGWVEEHREEHDDHDEVQASLEEHDEHDEPFEEEEDHSEVDDEEEEEEEEEHDDEHDDDDDDEEDDDDHEKDADAEDASEEVTAEQTKEVDDDEDEDEDDEDDNNDDDDDEQVAASHAGDADDADDDDDNDEAVASNEAEEDDDNATNEDDDDEDAPQTAEDNDDVDNDDDDDVAANNEDDDNDENNTEEEATAASPEADDNQDDNNDKGDDDGDDEDDDDDNNNQADDNDESVEPSHKASASRASKDNDFDDPFDEEDDDGTAESFESIVVDNDAEEKLLLKEKERRWAEQNQPPKDDNDDDEPEVANSFFTNHAKPSAEDLMKRRLTISSAEVTYPDDEDATPISEDEEQQISGEELEMEEEIEYVEEEEEVEIELDEHDQEIPPPNKYMPETFEDFNAMYRPKAFVPTESSARVEELKTAKAAKEEEASITKKKLPAVFTAPPPPPLVEAKIEPKPHTTAAKVSFSSIDPAAAKKPPSPSSPTETTTREVTHDLDFQPDEDDIDYTDTDEDYDEDEEIAEEEEEEIEDLLDDVGSDVDDTELMNRLEAKYGRLPSNEYESDEDPEDPTWTQIKPKQTPGGGPQTQEDDYHSTYNKIRQEPNPNVYEDDEYEREMAFAHDEMLRGNHIDALVAYFRITHNYPDRPMGFLRKAKLSNKLAKMKDDTGFRLQSVDAFKRYLAFDDLITNNAQFREAAEECIEIMRKIGQIEPAITIHRIVINRFPQDPELRNQMVITFLMMDRYYDAKIMLLETHKKWSKNGFTLTLLGYVLKAHDTNYTGAIQYLQQGINSNAKGTQDARFYIALGESYERLGKHEASLEIYKRGAELKLYPSAYQRSVYNELNLRAQPTWNEDQTRHKNNFKEIAMHWQVLRDEALGMLEGGGYFRKETENLVATGNWKELELFSRGLRNQRNCLRAPTTCRLIEQFPAAAKCRRGQVKFSVMHPGTHVRAHCGPTNCRLRAHLGLIVPSGTKLRVASQNMSWTEGAFLIFDDSFEHEVWHDGEHMRLILIVDFWHPDLSEKQIESLSAI